MVTKAVRHARTIVCYFNDYYFFYAVLSRRKVLYVQNVFILCYLFDYARMNTSMTGRKKNSMYIYMTINDVDAVAKSSKLSDIAVMIIIINTLDTRQTSDIVKCCYTNKINVYINIYI